VCPLGVGAQRCWSALLSSKSGITRLREEHSFDGSQSRVAGYVPKEELHEHVNKHDFILKNSKQLSRATIYSLLSAHEALGQAKLLDDEGQFLDKYSLRCGVAIGQGMVDFQDIYDNGSLLLGQAQADKRSGFKKMSPFFLTRVLMNMSAGNLGIRYRLNGPNHCVSTACASGAHAIGDAYRFIQSGHADLMVCGSTEASINSIAMAGFERLRALCVKFNDNPEESSRPFDEQRAGFVMGEGAGSVVLEAYEHAKKRGLDDNDIICEILGYGTSGDGYHLTAPSKDGLGARLSMEAALRDANIPAHRVTHINAHATSTPIGDEIECAAIENLFYSNEAIEDRSKQFTVTSCKSAIGHLLGAAGSVESIFAMLSCKDAIHPPCLNLHKPLSTPKNSVQFVREHRARWESDERIALKNSFGFGGTNASLLMSNLVNR